MRYIIEFEDEYSMNEGGMKYHQCKQVPYWSVSHGIIKNLTPYTEPDRKAIEDEVWKMARLISLEVYDGGLKPSDLYECYKSRSIQEVMKNHSYQEVKSKYDAWKNRKDEIRVGDEVVYADDPNKEKAIVLRLYQPKQYKTLADILCEDGTVIKMIKVENLAWTGRHFDEVEELLKKMKEQ